MHRKRCLNRINVARVFAVRTHNTLRRIRGSFRQRATSRPFVKDRKFLGGVPSVTLDSPCNFNINYTVQYT